MTIQDNREVANKTVRERESSHQQEYNDFKRQVAAIGSGDLSLMEQIMGLLNDCMPQDARNFYAYIFNYLMNPSSVADDQTAFSDYDQLAADCIFTLLSGLTMLAVYHAGLYNRGIIEDNTIASQKEIIERDKNTIDFMHGYIGFLEDYIKELKERNLEVKSAKTRK